MFDQIKANLFTIHGLVTTFLHVFIVVGFITCYITFQTEILGYNPLEAMQQTAAKGKR